MLMGSRSRRSRSTWRVVPTCRRGSCTAPATTTTTSSAWSSSQVEARRVEPRLHLFYFFFFSFFYSKAARHMKRESNSKSLLLFGVIDLTRASVASCGLWRQHGLRLGQQLQLRCWLRLWLQLRLWQQQLELLRA